MEAGAGLQQPLRLLQQLLPALRLLLRAMHQAANPNSNPNPKPNSNPNPNPDPDPDPNPNPSPNPNSNPSPNPNPNQAAAWERTGRAA